MRFSAKGRAILNNRVFHFPLGKLSTGEPALTLPWGRCCFGETFSPGETVARGRRPPLGKTPSPGEDALAPSPGEDVSGRRRRLPLGYLREAKLHASVEQGGNHERFTRSLLLS